MNTNDDAAARATLKMAGVFQGKRDLWVRRLETYFSEVERLVVGEWLDSTDLIGLVKESRLASREAIDGLANDLSAELLHESSSVFNRFESERAVLMEEITRLQASLSRLLSADEDGIRSENDALRSIVLNLPEYQLLCVIQQIKSGNYEEIADASGVSKAKVRKCVKTLTERGNVFIDKKSRPHRVHFVFAPWDDLPSEQTIPAFQNPEVLTSRPPV